VIRRVPGCATERKPALWPDRCKALVSVSGYLIGNQAAGKVPLPPSADRVDVDRTRPEPVPGKGVGFPVFLLKLSAFDECACS
jgi:hypothetical protein